VAKSAADEIKTGKRVGLGWLLTKLENSQFGRQKCQHKIIALEGPGGIGLGACFDDVYEMNPRRYFFVGSSLFFRVVSFKKILSCGFYLFRIRVNSGSAEQSSQWDGFRHYSQPRNTSDTSGSRERVFYGGTTKEEIMDASNHRIGIQHWSSQGIAGTENPPTLQALPRP
jgi:hypothetical protein